ncbi:Protein STRUBBELIG-RECEPTOR FAMILY 6 [Dichanthelium oligosanthes]|uniref:Protein STRUBBELIG-RECEPTOR FAMILY 6 n=1 Tax=Dichanthelium oligosanthes TaxID=888268 RepID=A0A1E5VZ04_9POAL|nr:Protein STRUBBELIG-RECEPTOR FAMILY 6 [Dichanthelium oligosanthes]
MNKSCDDHGVTCAQHLECCQFTDDGAANLQRLNNPSIQIQAADGNLKRRHLKFQNKATSSHQAFLLSGREILVKECVRLANAIRRAAAGCVTPSTSSDEDDLRLPYMQLDKLGAGSTAAKIPLPLTTAVNVLNTLFTSLNSPGQLKGWQANGGDPCGQSWQGVTCSGSGVTKIILPNLGLSGNLAYNMNSLGSLVELDMSQNSLGGGNQIQYNLPNMKLEKLNLAGNQFGGNLPYSISTMPNLKYLYLSHNQLQGNITDVFSSLYNLIELDLSFNSLTGDLPQSFTGLSSLKKLYLQNNQFTGYINVLANLPLDTLNLVNNRFTGWIPSQLKKINSIQTDGNSWSTGPAPPPPPYTAPPPPNRRNSPGQNGDGSSSSGGKSGIGGGGVAGIIISLLVVGAIIAFFLIKRRKHKAAMEEHFEQHQPFTSFPSNEVKDMKPIDESTAIDIESLASPASISLKPPPKIECHKSFDDDDFSNKPVLKKSNITPIKATVYSVADLQMATDSFSFDNLVGEGTFGRVYRAQFNGGKVLAIKKLDSTVMPFQSSDDFAELVSNISKLHHPNLNELVGYCMEHGQHLLVYDFHRNGSLHDLLHLSDEYSKPLSWNSRVKIALGSARALEYLHEICSPSIIHKNFKSSNILLDSEFNPHLSDAGLASFIPDAEFQAAEQSAGYTAPEVDMTGQYTLKSDVYSFGVVMLELLTGRRPFDSSRPRSEQSLVRWATPQLHDIDALDRMVDPALKGLYPAKSLSRFADALALCVQPEPEFRPPMSEVVQALVRLVQRANMTKRMLDGDTSRQPDEQDQDFI